MSHRYLFGPVGAAFADQSLFEARQSGQCLVFGPSEGLDLQIGATDSWEETRRRRPDGFEPAFIALYLPYTHVPPGLWSAPVPLLGLGADWNLLWTGKGIADNFALLILNKVRLLLSAPKIPPSGKVPHTAVMRLARRKGRQIMRTALLE